MTCRELIQALQQIEYKHGNIEVDLCAATRKYEAVADVTYDDGFATINFNKNEGK